MIFDTPPLAGAKPEALTPDMSEKSWNNVFFLLWLYSVNWPLSVHIQSHRPDDGAVRPFESSWSHWRTAGLKKDPNWIIWVWSVMKSCRNSVVLKKSIAQALVQKMLNVSYKVTVTALSSKAKQTHHFVMFSVIAEITNFTSVIRFGCYKKIIIPLRFIVYHLKFYDQ